jgi:pimeloyl-ACP methyl ester carboxylesterase
MRVRTVALTIAAAIGLGACGGGGQAASTTATGGSAANERAASLLARAERAIDAVRSFHLQANTNYDGAAVTVSGDFALPGRASLLEQYGTGRIELRALDGTVYFRANRAYYRNEGLRGTTLTELLGRWLSTTAAQLPSVAAFAALASPATLGRCLLGQRLGTLSLEGTTTVGGRRASVLVDTGDLPGSGSGRLYIAASGPPLPLRITHAGAYRTGGTTDPACHDAATPPVSTSVETISDVDAPVVIAAPPGAVSLASLASPAHATTGIAAAPVRMARTSLGEVAYRTVGSGPPLILITGYAGTMESWDPRFVNALATHYRVVIFDNAGIDGTSALAGPLTIDAMADQTAALISALGLARPNVLGWSMGGMIAQALAVLHPNLVHRLVLCATFAGDGGVQRPSQSAIDALTDGDAAAATADLFPPDQDGAAVAFGTAIAGYPNAAPVASATISAQAKAVIGWWNGTDPAGRRTTRIAAATLVADGTVDRLDPTSNSRSLARLIPGARLLLYADAGHAFLFQDETAFVRVIESFLG